MLVVEVVVLTLALAVQAALAEVVLELQLHREILELLT
jgi:hypothetical protein